MEKELNRSLPNASKFRSPRLLRMSKYGKRKEIFRLPKQREVLSQKLPTNTRLFLKALSDKIKMLCFVNTANCSKKRLGFRLLFPVCAGHSNALGWFEKKTLRADEQDKEDVDQLRQDFFEVQLGGVAPKDLIVLDESSVNTAMTRRYARAKKGQRAYASAPRNWGKNVTMICAISIQKVETGLILEGAIDGQMFLLFVQQWLVPLLGPGKVVVMDNLSVHKVAGVREAIEAVGARVEYLPPYSPDFSPIEPMFSKVKTFLRGISARTQDLLLEAIPRALDTVTASDLCGWFTHCGYHVEET